MLISSPRKAFLAKWTKTITKLFLVLWIGLTWFFEGTPEGGAIWAGFLALFIGAGGMYLRWDDALSDSEVLWQIKRGPEFVAWVQSKQGTVGVGADHE